MAVTSYFDIFEAALSNARGIVVACESTNKAVALRHALNRWRAAERKKLLKYEMEKRKAKGDDTLLPVIIRSPYDDLTISLDGNKLVIKEQSFEILSIETGQQIGTGRGASLVPAMGLCAWDGKPFEIGTGVPNRKGDPDFYCSTEHRRLAESGSTADEPPPPDVSDLPISGSES